MGKKDRKADSQGDTSRLRIAIVNDDRCKPKKCQQECKRNCPVVRTGKFCIEVDKTSKLAFISEALCIGCGICVKKCPFDAINIINLPKDLGKDTTHRYGPNTFKLHRLPVPRAGQVLGLVGINGIGKSTALKILAGKLKPNLGRYKSPPEWSEIVTAFRGSELQNFFKHIVEDDIKAVVKPQYVDQLATQGTGTVESLLRRRGIPEKVDKAIQDLELGALLERDIRDLSGGELQRFTIALVVSTDSDVYMFDEPSSYLDASQRIKAAQTIRKVIQNQNYVIAVEHDLSVLDYLSDYICVLWGKPGVYGVVTTPFSVREGINIFLDGFVPTENLRFRDFSLSFKVTAETEDAEEVVERSHFYRYPHMFKALGTFKLEVLSGGFSESEIIVLLGRNGAGKTTLIRMLAGVLEPDNTEGMVMPKLSVSYKPQILTAKFQGTVRALLNSKARDSISLPLFQTDVVKPMQLDTLYDQEVQFLSGGELQRVALVVALGKNVHIYLIDEPSAHLDSEQRIVAARVIKRFIFHAKKTAFVVEHDFIMATYLADRVIVFDGEVGMNCIADSPEPLVVGMNKFLKKLEITFRRDPTNYRPRINKLDSVKDKEQKLAGTYFVLEE